MEANDTPIEQTVIVQAPPEAVFRALTQAADLIRWWPSRAESDPRPGGPFHYVWEFQDPAQNGTQQGTYQEVVPNEKLSYPWNAGMPTLVEFTLGTADGGTTVHLRHSGWGAGAEAAQVRQMHSGIWQVFLANLQSYLADGVDRRSEMLGQIVAAA